MQLQFVVSIGFILPVNASQNMISYGTDTFEGRDFISTELAITLAATVLLTVFPHFLALDGMRGTAGLKVQSPVHWVFSARTRSPHR
jgi:Sodium:sulfate symporter transmembrane region